MCVHVNVHVCLHVSGHTYLCMCIFVCVICKYICKYVHLCVSEDRFGYLSLPLNLFETYSLFLCFVNQDLLGILLSLRLISLKITGITYRYLCSYAWLLLVLEIWTQVFTFVHHVLTLTTVLSCHVYDFFLLFWISWLYNSLSLSIIYIYIERDRLHLLCNKYIYIYIQNIVLCLDKNAYYYS